MLSKTKLFLIGYFLPAWIASLLMWGDERTSASFEAAPHWFYRAQLVTQFFAILILFLPLKIRSRPSPLVLFLALVVIVSLYFSNPILEAEFVLAQGSTLIAIVAIFLSFMQPSATFEESDIRLLFYLFLGGFLLQGALFLGFGRLPSHSIADVLIRFNGITNDSLSSGFIISLFIPWAVSTRRSVLKVLAIMAESFASGSLFSVVFVPIAIFGYLIYRRLYRFLIIVVLFTIAVMAYFYALFESIISLKFLSILTHLRFFLNLIGADYQQPTASCSQEFCESFLESGMYLSPLYLVAFYALMLCFLVPVFRSEQFRTASSLIPNTLRVYGTALIVGSFVHPVPLIPFAIPLFLIFTSLYLGDAMTVRSTRSRGRTARSFVS